MSKRHGDTAVTVFKKDYLPEALLNFLGAMSYTFSKELLTKEEMIEEFELSKVHKSGAVFNVDKLNWINSQYIRRLTSTEFKSLTGLKIPDSAVPLVTERLEKLSDVKNFDYLWQEPEYEKELLIWKDSRPEDVKNSLEESRKILEKTEDKEKVRKALDELGQKIGNRGLVYWPLRVAVTGKEKSPDPVEVVAALNREDVLKRIDVAINKL